MRICVNIWYKCCYDDIIAYRNTSSICGTQSIHVCQCGRCARNKPETTTTAVAATGAVVVHIAVVVVVAVTVIVIVSFIVVNGTYPLCIHINTGTHTNTHIAYCI